MYLEEQADSQRLLLLVEDNEVTAAILLQLLEENVPYRVQRVADAEHAWQVFQHRRPDLILLDYQLPGMSGLELYDRMQGNDTLRGIPTIMLGVALPKSELARRGVAFLTKPFEEETLLFRIGEVLDDIP